MKTTYLIWKDPTCAGVNPEWQEISGQEFYAFIHSAEAKGRYFIKLPSTHADRSDGAIVMEVTEDDCRKWKREKNHANYLSRIAKPYITLSYHAMESDDGENFGEETLADDIDIEFDYIKSQEPAVLKAALEALSGEEREIVKHLYLTDKHGTERSYAAMSDISNATAHRMKVSALKKLKNIFEVE